MVGLPVVDYAAVGFRSWKIIKQIIYGSLLAAFFIILGVVLTSFVTSFFTFYNLLDSFISNINSYGGGNTLSKFFGLLSCMGFTQALSDTKAAIASSLVFLLARIISAQFIYAYFVFLRVISPLIH